MQRLTGRFFSVSDCFGNYIDIGDELELEQGETNTKILLLKQTTESLNVVLTEK